MGYNYGGMTVQITEPGLGLEDSIALAIIAGLLSLLPVMILFWVYYMREKQPTVPGRAIVKFFTLGAAAVGLSLAMEYAEQWAWYRFSPNTIHFFYAQNVAYDSILYVLLAFLVQLLFVALAEEGFKYLLMRRALSRTADADQLIDGVQLGFAVGLGFAFLENTIYFLDLFSQYQFSTLVVVFFLRFLYSTFGHMTFGGVMGYLMMRGLVHPTERKRYIRLAFLVPWLLHAIFNFLLDTNMSFFLPPLLALAFFFFWSWWHDGQFFQLHVLHGRRLKYPVAQKRATAEAFKGARTIEVLPSAKACPNCFTPIAPDAAACKACGMKFLKKQVPKKFPFMPLPQEK